MVHALARFVQERAQTKEWGPTDLARESGLSKQLCSNWLNDQRDKMPRLPAPETVAGFAKAFRVSREWLLAQAIESLGVGYEAGDFVNSVSTASDRELLEEIEERLKKRGGEHADGSAPNTPDDPGPGAQVIDINKPDETSPAAQPAKKVARKTGRKGGAEDDAT